MRIANLFRAWPGITPRDIVSRPRLAGVGLQSRGDLRWTAVSSDPQFHFRGLGKTVGSLVVFLEAPRGERLTPRLYLDWGEGFFEEDSVGFEACDAALLRVRFGAARGLRALRLDPFERTGEVAIRFAPNARGERLAAEVEPALSPSSGRRGTVLRQDVNLDDRAPQSNGRTFGQNRPPRSAHEQFLRATALAERELANFQPAAPARPLLSFVSPLYNTPTAYLDDLYASFRIQRPNFAELVLSDDGSTSPQTAKWLAAHEGEPGIVVVRHGVNRGIAAAANAGIAAARGDWVGFIDHDDALSSHAVARILKAIDEFPAARFFYTDEAIADAKLRVIDVFDKPAFDDVLLSGVNYINHLSLFRRDLVEAAGGLREGYEGSQDYDLLLRALARLKRDEVRHIPYPAYLWRRDGRSYSVKFIEKATANARRALCEAYARDGAPAEVGPALLPDLHRLRLGGRASRKVSIVVPNRDAVGPLAKLVDRLLHATDFPDFELIVVDDGSAGPDTLALYDRLAADRRFTLATAAGPFNLSRWLNRGCAVAKGDAILRLHSDVEPTDPHWLSEMTACLAYPDVGLVGARLLTPAGRLRHAGIVVGLGGLAGSWHSDSPADFPGPMGRLAVRSTLPAVTGACMLITRACLEATGPFDEETFGAAYGDVDFCLRARAAGFRTLYTPFATLVQHGSAGDARDLRAEAALREIHGARNGVDSATSPWRDPMDARRVTPDTLPPAR